MRLTSASMLACCAYISISSRSLLFASAMVQITHDVFNPAIPIQPYQSTVIPRKNSLQRKKQRNQLREEMPIRTSLRDISQFTSDKKMNGLR